ncbi:MAG: DUF6263 family protein [Polaribacter sp.]|uniref:DUF6263 family protein n=1 Tax=Polaribacter sp. TaxID=1920175 RepID=UPI0032669B7B
MKKLFVLFLVIAANVTIAQDSQNEVLLRLNYEKGATYNVAMKVNQEMGTLMSMGVSVNMDIKVLDVTDNTYDSEMRFTKMAMDVLQGGQAISYDSSKSDDELDDTGKMMKVQMEPMLKAVIYLKGNNLGEVLETKIEPTIAGMEDLAKQSSNIIYPKEALKVGSSWNMVKNEKGMKMNFIYTVKSISNKTIVLDLTGDISGMATGKIFGNMNIETSSGIPVESFINMDMNIGGQESKSKITMTMSKK